MEKIQNFSLNILYILFMKVIKNMRALEKFDTGQMGTLILDYKISIILIETKKK